MNYFTHGSQVTAAHGHLAFFGAYALLNFTMFWYAIPRLRGNMNVNKNFAISGFWLMSLAVLGLGSAMAVAGIIQTYVERVLGDGFMVAQSHMQLWFKIVIFFGVLLIVGLLVTIWNMVFAKRAPLESEAIV